MVFIARVEAEGRSNHNTAQAVEALLQEGS